MISDEVSVYNMALDAVGTRSDVSATTEQSREAEVCRLWFGPTRDLVLRAAPWSVATGYSRLALLATRNDTLAWVATDPAPGYHFAYAAPSDMIAPRFMSTYGRFIQGKYGNQRALMTQDEAALLVYTRLEEQVALWDSDLAMAIVLGLAAAIAMPLHGKAQRAKNAQDQANILILQARANDANAQENQLDTIPDWIAARGSNFQAPNNRFFFPYGPLISVTEAAAVR